MFTKLFDANQPTELTEATLTINGIASTYREAEGGLMLSRNGIDLAFFRRTDEGFKAEPVEGSTLTPKNWDCYNRCVEECRAAGNSPCADECTAKCF